MISSQRFAPPRRISPLVHIAWLLAASGLARGQGTLVISTPLNASECAATLLVWSDGVVPYLLEAVVGEKVLPIVRTTQVEYNWTVNLPRGETIQLNVTDYVGSSGRTATFTIQPGDPHTCQLLLPISSNSSSSSSWWHSATSKSASTAIPTMSSSSLSSETASSTSLSADVSSSSLGGGMVAAIVVPVVAFVSITTVLLWWWWRRKRVRSAIGVDLLSEDGSNYGEGEIFRVEPFLSRFAGRRGGPLMSETRGHTSSTQIESLSPLRDESKNNAAQGTSSTRRQSRRDTKRQSDLLSLTMSPVRSGSTDEERKEDASPTKPRRESDAGLTLAGGPPESGSEESGSSELEGEITLPPAYHDLVQTPSPRHSSSPT